MALHSVLLDVLVVDFALLVHLLRLVAFASDASAAFDACVAPVAFADAVEAVVELGVEPLGH